jgi:urease accessory protein
MVCDIEVSEDAAMVVTTPGATRSHFMGSGEAKVEQKFQIRDRAFLEFNPGSLILQKSTSLVQNTLVEVEKGAEVLFVEEMLPGRIAHGESFLFRKFSNRLKVLRKGKLVLLESFTLEPENESVNPWKNSFPTPFYGCFYLVSSKVSGELSCRHEIHDMANDGLLVGSTSMHNKAGWLVKVLAGDPYQFRKAMNEIREALYHAIGRLPPSFRRY